MSFYLFLPIFLYQIAIGQPSHFGFGKMVVDALFTLSKPHRFQRIFIGYTYIFFFVSTANLSEKTRNDEINDREKTEIKIVHFFVYVTLFDNKGFYQSIFAKFSANLIEIIFRCLFFRVLLPFFILQRTYCL